MKTQKQINKIWYQNNREKKQEQTRKYYYINREKILKKCKIYSQLNKEKIRKQKIKYYKKNKKKIMQKKKEYLKRNFNKWYKCQINSILKNRHNITLREYDILLETQKGRCAICNNFEKIRNRNLAVDHNHKTKKIRGLLCYRCNILLGFAQDDINYLLKAVSYLKRSNK